MNVRHFFSELKRRRVFRVTGIYVIIAWIVIQVADTTFPVLLLPDWTVRLVVALFLLGIPVVVVLAWVFDITPEGIERTRAGAAEPDAAAATRPVRSVRLLPVQGLAVLLLAALGMSVYRYAPLERPPQDSAAGISGPAGEIDRSLAVLPFVDFSPGSDQEWFSDGLTEEILNALARLPDLRVASRTSSFRFRGRGGHLRAIADSLEVAHVLEGSVRRDGDRVRITAQLVRADDDAHLWSQTFEREARDVMRVQEEIAYEIARTLQTALRPEELARMVAAGTNSVAAHEAFLRYWHLFYRAWDTEDWALQLEALAELERAVAHDPRFFRAHDRAAAFWIEQLTPPNRAYGISRTSYPERHQRALSHLRAAEAAAPDAVSRLQVERLRARLELRLQDAVEIGRRIVRELPSGEEWYQLAFDAVHVGRFEEARSAYAEAARRHHEVLVGFTNLAQQRHRVDAAAAAAMVDQVRRDGPLGLNDLYQAHRILLGAGRIADARLLAEEYIARAAEPRWQAVMEVRQLCAERRTAEAEALVARADSMLAADPQIRWHVLTYIGRPAEAADALRHFDQAGELFSLSTYLRYTHFDPRAYPNLAAALRRTGSLRKEPLSLPYICSRTDG